MGNALNSMSLYNRGMLFIPNVWFTLIWAVGHETQHAIQVDYEPQIAAFEKLPQEYEDEATARGKELTMEWSANNTVPELNNMGWLGKQLVVLLNNVYTQYPDIIDEPSIYRKNAIATLESVLALNEFTVAGRQLLIDGVNKGDMGIKIGEQRYLTAYEFLGL